MANNIDANPMQVDTISTATLPLIPPGRNFTPARIMVQATLVGKTITLRHGSMTGDIIYTFTSTAQVTNDDLSLKGTGYYNGIYVSELTDSVSPGASATILALIYV